MNNSMLCILSLLSLLSYMLTHMLHLLPLYLQHSFCLLLYTTMPVLLCLMPQPNLSLPLCLFSILHACSAALYTPLTCLLSSKSILSCSLCSLHAFPQQKTSSYQVDGQWMEIGGQTPGGGQDMCG